MFSTVQVFDCTFEKNFFSLSLSELVGDGVSVSTRAAVISLSFLLPHAYTVVVSPFVQRVRP
jgi:hypothetical protein